LGSAWHSPQGELVHSFTSVLTINADTHPLMQQFQQARRGKAHGGSGAAALPGLADCDTRYGA
jgi:hypothetical protein